MNKQQTKSIPVVRLREEQCDYYMNRGGIDGSEIDGRPASTAAYDENVQRLVDAMAPLGKLGFQEDDDYYIDRYANPDFLPVSSY